MTATAGDDAYPSTIGVTSLTVNGVPMNLRTVPLDFRSGGVTGMLYDFEPWRRPDRNPMPWLVPFPRLARVARRARDARMRASDALDVLRHGLPETDW